MNAVKKTRRAGKIQYYRSQHTHLCPIPEESILILPPNTVESNRSSFVDILIAGSSLIFMVIVVIFVFSTLNE